MASKSIEVIQGDTLTLGFRVSAMSTGPIDFSDAAARLYANVTDMSGRRVLAKFEITPVNLENGEFRIHLTSSSTSALRGKNLWAVRYEYGDRTITLAGGDLTVKVGA